MQFKSFGSSRFKRDSNKFPCVVSAQIISLTANAVVRKFSKAGIIFDSISNELVIIDSVSFEK